MVNCQHIEPKLYSYVEGTGLNLEERKEVEEHLICCDLCQKSFREWQQIINLLSNQKKIKPPSDFTLNVMIAINRVRPVKTQDQFWLINLYKNLGRGLVAAGIITLFLNSWALFGNLPVDNFFDKTFLVVQEIGEKYFRIYDQVAFSLENWNIRGGLLKK